MSVKNLDYYMFLQVIQKEVLDLNKIHKHRTDSYYDSFFFNERIKFKIFEIDRLLGGIEKCQ